MQYSSSQPPRTMRLRLEAVNVAVVRQFKKKKERKKERRMHSLSQEVAENCVQFSSAFVRGQSDNVDGAL